MKTLLPIFYLLALQTFAQSPTLVNRQALHFALTVPNDTIDFIVVDSTLSEKKPVLLWCQGSLPIPLFIQAPGYGAYLLGGGVGNFNLPEIRKQYHLVVISMPETPLIVDETHLDRSFCYLPDTSNPRQFSQAYLEADYLENYTNRALAVLRFLRSQPWVTGMEMMSRNGRVSWQIRVSDPEVAEDQLVPLALACGEVTVCGFGRKAQNLEDVFLSIVKEGNYER